MKNKYSDSIDPDCEKVKSQLRELLNEYLRIDSDDIVDSVQLFFEPYQNEGPMLYSNAATNALFMFASKRKARAFMKEIGDNDYFFICDLLRNVIIFCNNIARREANLVRLDKSKLENGYSTSNDSLERLLTKKMRYESKLRHLREIHNM
jgi:hypothetical protein